MFFELYFRRQRTNLSLVLYALYLITLGLSYRKVSNVIKVFVERSSWQFGNWFKGFMVLGRYSKLIVEFLFSW